MYVDIATFSVRVPFKHGKDNDPKANFSSEAEIYNGAVEAAATLLGAINVFIVGFVSVNWVKWGDAAIVVVAAVSAFLLYMMGTTDEIWVAYVGQSLWGSTIC